MKEAKRFLRAEYSEAKKTDNTASRDDFWRKIEGQNFYLHANKISNLNFTYFATAPLDTLAEQKLKSMNIDATVQIEPTAELTTPKKIEGMKSQLESTPYGGLQGAGSQQREINFGVCKHCLLNGRPGNIPRVSADTVLVSRSDGRSYHLYLQVGPRRQPSLRGGTVPGIFLAHFRYALDSQKITNEPVIVLIQANFKDSKAVNEIVEKIVDKLANILEDSRKPAKFYKWDNRNNFSEMVPAS